MHAIELRLHDIPAVIWREELAAVLSTLDPQATLREPSSHQQYDVTTHRVIDPSVLVALISGTATIIGALIPHLISILKKRRGAEEARVVIVIHGTKDSVTLQSNAAGLDEDAIAAALRRIGAPTGVDIRPAP